LGLAAVVRVRPRNHRPQGHGSGIGSQVEGGAALASVYRAGAGLVPPFFDGFLEPSSNT
jgi:hypothetical protein